MVKKQTISKPLTTTWGNSWTEEKFTAITKYETTPKTILYHKGQKDKYFNINKLCSL